MKRFFLKYFNLLLDKILYRSFVLIEGDSLPKLMPIRAIVVVAEDDEFWCVGLKCPCGCGYTIELPVIKEAKPRWDIKINSQNKISLYPSVFLKKAVNPIFGLKMEKLFGVN